MCLRIEGGWFALEQREDQWLGNWKGGSYIVGMQSVLKILFGHAVML